MPQFRKKPVVIEAVRFDGSYDCAFNLAAESKGPIWLESIYVGPEGERKWTGRLKVETLEGVMIANPGDWIITGVKGERYPCKPDVFALTYDPV